MDQTPEKGFSIGWVILIIVVVAAIVGGGLYILGKTQGQREALEKQTSTTAPKTTEKPKATTPSPTPATDETAGWKTYKNEQYGFELRYPPNSDWRVEERRSSNQDGFFVTNSLGKCKIGILPNGEFDLGLPADSPKISEITFGGVRAEQKLWEKQSVKMIKILDSVKNWSKTDNRIDVTCSDSSEINQILSSFKFIP